MKYPKCSIKTNRIDQRQLSTGQRIERQCELCDGRFITYTNVRREIFVRWIDETAFISPEQQRAFDTLCYGLSQAPLNDAQQRRAIAALKLTKIAVGARGKSPAAYFQNGRTK